MHRLRSLLFLSLTLFAALVSSAQTFRNPYRIPTNVDPTTIAVGDFNGDGRADIAWVDISTTPHTLHILLAQPVAGYLPAPSITFQPATGIEECLVDDFNRDGHQDIVCTYSNLYDNAVNVFFGNGDGTFQPPVSTTVPAFNNGGYAYPTLELAGDLNGDGFPDLIEGQVQSGANQILLGNGKGGFQITSMVSAGINSPAPVVADINGDNKPDLLLAWGPAFELGKGDGTFQLPVTYSVPPYTPACVFHDMDGDGHLDAVCSYEFNSNSIHPEQVIYHGNPDGTFNTTAPIASQNFDTPYISGAYLSPMAVYDANGDGIPDVLAYAYDGVALLLGQPGLTFAYPTHYAVGYMPFDISYPQYQFILADMNGDDIPDVVAIGPHGIYISYGQHDGSLATAPAYEVGGFVRFATVADFTGDSIPDVVSSGDTALMLSAGKGDGSFAAPTPLPNSGGVIDFSVGNVIQGDFTGDGKQDLMAAGRTNNATMPYVLLGHGDGTFSAPIQATGVNSTVQLSGAAAVDINRDGRTDLLTTGGGAGGGRLISSLSNGDGTFTQVTTIVPDDPYIYSSTGYFLIPQPALADFNGDGKLDAAYGGFSNVFVVQGNGDGSFNSTGVTLPIPALSGIAASGSLATVAGDFDGDGNADFAVLAGYGAAKFPFNTFNTAVWVFYGDGHGNFSSPVLAGSFDRGFSTLAASDLSRNGLQDLVLSFHSAYGSTIDQAAGDSLAIVHSQPNRSFGPEIDYTAGVSTEGPIIADLNQDGYPDLLVPNSSNYTGATTNSVTVLLNSGPAPTVAGYLSANPEPSMLNQPFAITATLVPSDSGAVLAGNISFLIDGVSIGLSTLAGNAASIAGPASLSAGTHQLTATWPGNSTYASVTLNSTHLVITPVAAVLTASPTSAVYDGAPITLTATISPATPPGSGTPTGSVTFVVDGVSGSPQTIASGTATLSLTGLVGGSHTFGCKYSGGSIYSSSTCNSASATITPAPTNFGGTVQPVPAYAFQSITFQAILNISSYLGGNGRPIPGPDNITIAYGGTPTILSLVTDANGTANDTIASGIPPGNYTVNYAFAGTASLQPASASIPFVVLAAPTVTTLTASPNPAYQGQTVTLTATLGSSSTVAPAGIVNFMDAGSLIGSSAVNASGVATYTTSTLALGSHPLTAVYTPSTNAPFSGSSSNTVTEVIAVSSFNLALSPNTLTITAGKSGSTTILLSSLGVFSGPLTLHYGALPQYATGSLSASTVNLTVGGNASATFTLQTSLLAGNQSPQRPGSRIAPITLCTLLVLLPLAFRRRLRSLLVLCIAAIAFQILTGCTMIRTPFHLAAPGTYQIPITAIDINNNTATQTLTVIVQ